METVNEQIKSNLPPIKNVIALIEKYENTMNGEGRRLIIEQIIESKSALQQAVRELSRIK